MGVLDELRNVRLRHAGIPVSLGSELEHQAGGVVPSVEHLELGRLQVLVGRIDYHVVVPVQHDLYGCRGAVERDRGLEQGCRGGVDREADRVALDSFRAVARVVAEPIVRLDGAGDRKLVGRGEFVGGDQWPEHSVYDSGRKGLGLRWGEVVSL